MKRTQWLLLGGMGAVSLNLRPAVASVAPVLETIHTELAISNAVASLLTTIPVVCMGLFALLVPAITKRSGRIMTILWGTVLIAITTAARVGGRSVIILFGSTVLVSVGIGVTQAVLPALVTEYFPNRTAFATGVYTSSMTGGAILATLLTAPIAGLLSWPVALAFWMIPAVIAIPVWLIATRTKQRTATGAEETATETYRVGLPWRQHSAWILIAVFGGATTTFFFVLTWLAPRYVALGWSTNSAGVLLTISLAVSAVSNLFISAVGDQWHDKRPLFLVVILCLVAGGFGVALVPLYAPFLWAIMLGMGSGGLFTLCMTLPISHAGTHAEIDRLTAMMLGVGYSVGAFGPVAGGILRDLTGSDTVMFSTFAVFAFCLLAPVAAIKTTETAGKSASGFH